MRIKQNIGTEIPFRTQTFWKLCFEIKESFCNGIVLFVILEYFFVLERDIYLCDRL